MRRPWRGRPEGRGDGHEHRPGHHADQTDELRCDQTLAVAANLQQAYGVGQDQVTSTFIGPTWGEAISRQMVLGLIVFLVLVTVLMAIYFRTWKMSLAAVIGLFYVVALTAGIYGATGFEVTPSAIIGFLTILSYALYDTVVVFDKIRENTEHSLEETTRTFGENVNLAINQTLVRSINTSVVGILPVGSILFIGAFLLGAGTLRDIALAIFVGIIVGTLATIFIQAPLYALLRRGEDGSRPTTRECSKYAAPARGPRRERTPSRPDSGGRGRTRLEYPARRDARPQGAASAVTRRFRGKAGSRGYRPDPARCPRRTPAVPRPRSGSRARRRTPPPRRPPSRTTSRRPSSNPPRPTPRRRRSSPGGRAAGSPGSPGAWRTTTRRSWNR